MPVAWNVLFTIDTIVNIDQYLVTDPITEVQYWDFILTVGHGKSCNQLSSCLCGGAFLQRVGELIYRQPAIQEEYELVLEPSNRSLLIVCKFARSSSCSAVAFGFVYRW